ncbi:MAG: ATP-binding cassette domain-containing protein [Lachnospiraceae bacterium]|nr:ATP-binding cassette domain-containing protein [Lachnospiraceae bacterium]
MELTVKSLSKSYGSVKALDSFQYSFTEGIYGLLGPNGAGKSTLMNILTANLKPSEGCVQFDGQDIFDMGRAYRKLLGYMPQQQGVYSGYTLERFLFYMSVLKGIPRKEAERSVSEIVERVRLSDCLHRRLGEFSGGMKQRALIAQALLGNPRIIILDEPTAGLDPRERINVRNLIAEVAFDRIVLIATHVVTDISFVAKEVLLMKKGTVIDAGRPIDLCERKRGKVYELALSREMFEKVRDSYRISSIREEMDTVFVKVIADTPPQELHAKVANPDLEDVYLYHFD